MTRTNDVELFLKTPGIQPDIFMLSLGHSPLQPNMVVLTANIASTKEEKGRLIYFPFDERVMNDPSAPEYCGEKLQEYRAIIAKLREMADCMEYSIRPRETPYSDKRTTL